MRINDFLLNSLQCTVFTPAYRIIPTMVMGRIGESLPAKFDGDPFMLPIPEGAPPEIPAIIFHSKDKQWQLELASARLNYRWVQMADSQQISPQAFLEELVTILGHYLEIEKPRVGRMGLVLSRYQLISDTAGVISRHFCQEIWLQNAMAGQTSFELHSNKKGRLANEFDVNSWIRYKSGELRIPDTPKRPIILVEQDVNTLAERTDSASYSTKQISEFFTQASVEMETRFRATLGV